MIVNQGEILTSEFCVIDCEGACMINTYDLGNEWDIFYLREGGSLGDPVAFNGILLKWSLNVTSTHG